MAFYDLSKKSWQWITLLILALVWGSSFILMKRGLRSFDYSQVAALRVFLSFVILMPLYPKLVKKLTLKNSIHLVIAGYAGIFFPAFLFTKAQTEINSSLAGMINSLAPFFALIMGILFYKNRPTKNQFIGIFMGLIGAIGLVSNGQIFNSLQSINKYALYVVVATVFYGINANQIRFKLSEFTGIEVTALAFLFTGPAAGVVLIFSDFSTVQSSDTWLVDFGFIFILAAVGSVISLFFFNSLVQYTSALFATSVTYIIPFFAIIWGVLDGEKITLVHMLSIGMALIGVWLINSRRGKRAKTT